MPLVLPSPAIAFLLALAVEIAVWAVVDARAPTVAALAAVTVVIVIEERRRPQGHDHNPRSPSLLYPPELRRRGVIIIPRRPGRRQPIAPITNP